MGDLFKIRIMKKAFCVSSFLLAAMLLVSCGVSRIQTISEEELFKIPYGNFEEQISVTDLNGVGDCRFGIAMQDGFFYLINGESKKIMELNSYGDLLSLYYNEDSQTAKLIEKSNRKALSVHHVIAYPFDYTGKLAIDSQKNVYTVCSIPVDRQEQNEDATMLYCNTVLRISRDGSSVDYIGQQGPGGTPFPYIKNLYITQKDELVVVSTSSDGAVVYWFASDGFLKYMIPISLKSVPQIQGKENNEIFCTIDNVIPDLQNYCLYLKVDYYTTFLDEESKVQSGINYVQTVLYPLDISMQRYGEGTVVPPYEESIVVDYSRLTYKIPYDFLGVTKNGWHFFIIKTDDGFNVEMIQPDTQKILRRHFTADHNQIMFDTMTVSADGIITALYLDKEIARVVWYRTDNLIASFLKK